MHTRILNTDPPDRAAIRSHLHSNFADECIASHVTDFRVLKSPTGQALLQKAPDGVVTVVDKDVLFEPIARHAIGIMTRSEAKREILDAVYNRLPVVLPDQIAPYVFKSDTSNKLTWQRLLFDRDLWTLCPEPFRIILNSITTETARQSLILWVGSLLDYTSPRAQYLYMYGDGGEGKSLFAAALRAMFGGQGATPVTASMLENRFGASLIMGKRLVQFNEENNPRFTSSGAFKRLTGEDDLIVERKGKDAFVVPAFHKVLVSSNIMLDAAGMRADKRRLLPTVWMRKDFDSDLALEARVRDTSAQFVQYADAEYQKWRDDKKIYTIPMCDETYDHLDATSDAGLTDDDLEGLLENVPETASEKEKSQRLPLVDLSAAIRTRFGLKVGDNKRLKYYIDRLTVRHRLFRHKSGSLRYFVGVRLPNPAEPKPKDPPKDDLE